MTSRLGGNAVRIGVMAVFSAACSATAPPVATPRAPPASRPVAVEAVAAPTEEKAEYWVEKLPTDTADAVVHLLALFNRALQRTHDENARDNADANVKSLSRTALAPLVKTYVEHYADLDSKTRVRLIKLFAELSDPAIEPAVKKAFEEFASHPHGRKEDQDIKWAAVAAGDLKLHGVAPSMIAAFDQLQASTMLGGLTYRDFMTAMTAIADKAWLPTLRAKLEAPVVPPKGPRDRALIDPYRDQLFWQTAAAKVLGVIGDPSGVRPLLRVLLDPSKADIQATALLALVRLGKPSIAAATELLEGRDRELIDFSTRRLNDANAPIQGHPERQTAALVLGVVGRSDGAAPLVRALAKNSDPVLRAVVARELAKIPATPESKRAFEKAFESIGLDTVIPPGSPALEMLAESAGQFYDPTMIPWLLDRAQRAKGDPEALQSLQGAITVVVLKLAQPDQLEVARKAVDRYGTQLEQDLYAQVDALVRTCGYRVPCYLDAVSKSDNQEQSHQFTGIKASYMLGILGSESTCDELVARLDAIDNAAVRFTTAMAIDHLSPNGSRSVVHQLGAIIDKNERSPDRDRAAADEPLRQVMLRLQARGGP